MKTYKTWIYLILSSLILCAPALYNGYPLLFSDSGSYIHSAFTLQPPVSRPLGYGLFIMIFSARLTLWTVIFFQNLIINILIWNVLKFVISRKKMIPYHFISIVVLMLLSSLSWYSCQIMPDFFTSMMILVLFLIFVKERISIPTAFFLYALLFFSLISHFSHFPILVLTLITLLIWSYFQTDLFLKGRRLLIRLSVTVAVLIGALSFMMASNAFNNHGAKISLTSNVFLSARLAETGILKAYLSQNCPDEENFLCEYKDSIPFTVNHFLWTNQSPINKAVFKNWIEADSALRPVVNSIFCKPRYLLWFGWEGIKATCRQLFKVDIGSGLIAFREDSPPHYPIKKYLPGEEIEMLMSEQSWGKLDFKTLNTMNYAVLAFSLLVIFMGVYYKKSGKTLLSLIIISGVVIFYNTAITATLSNISHRKQARLTWILVFIALILIFEAVKILKEKYIGAKSNKT